MNSEALLAQWRRDLAAWAIPEPIARQSSDSPWVLPREVFVRRARRQLQQPAGPSFERAWQALEPAGTVLDVGTGGGAACLPLAPRTTELTAVDADPELMNVLVEQATRLGVATTPVLGRWPDVAADVPMADVVTCYNVLFNVSELGPFVTALTAHARRLIVVELTVRHPLTGLNPLWEHFHGVRRPDGPTAQDVIAILCALGLNPAHVSWSRPPAADHASFDDLVDVTRRRLCLPPERAGEIAAELRDLGVDASAPDLGTWSRELVTIWWQP